MARFAQLGLKHCIGGGCADREKGAGRIVIEMLTGVDDDVAEFSVFSEGIGDRRCLDDLRPRANHVEYFHLYGGCIPCGADIGRGQGRFRLEYRCMVSACSSCHFGSCSQRILRRSQAENPLSPAVQIFRAASS